MHDHFYAVIMAGGGGTRLWPVSRKDRPKQLVRLGGDQSLFQQALERIGGVFPPDRIYVVTVAEQAVELRREAPQLPEENFLIETMPRGTASVVGLAAVALSERDPQAVMAILTADHIIRNQDYFNSVLENALVLAEDNFLVTLGIRPTFPATGYGYIQRGVELTQYPFVAYEVRRFKEKPDEATARSFLERGDHDWNSGMFVWRVSRILSEFQRLMPDLEEKLNAIQAAWGTPERGQVVSAVWPTIKPQTIDYGIMEKAEKVAVVPAADLGWNDVGSWESMFEVFDSDENGNVVLDSNFIGIDTTDSLVVSDEVRRLIVTIGVNSLVVVDTPTAILVCSREDAQKVREVVSILKEKNQAEYL